METIEKIIAKIDKADKGISGIIFLLSRQSNADFSGKDLLGVSALLQDQLLLLVEAGESVEAHLEGMEQAVMSLNQMKCALEGLVITLSHVENVEFNGRDMVGVSKLLRGQLDFLVEIRSLIKEED